MLICAYNHVCTYTYIPTYIRVYIYTEREIWKFQIIFNKIITKKIKKKWAPKEKENQYIYKPCQDKSEYNRSIKLLDTSGMVSLEEATRRSINTVFAQLASEIGGEKLASTAKRIGIESELEPVISLTLGAGAVTPIELASAYSSFATNGKLAPPYLIEKIEDSNGQLLYKHIISTRTSIPDPAAAAAVRKTLEVAAQFGTGTRAVLNDRPIAGKTGTHQGFREAWFIGFIPQYTSSVWIGFAEEQLPLTDVEINGELIKNVSGGRVPAPIWKEFMEEHSQENTWVDDEGLIVQATALIIGRNIHIVGSANYSGQDRPYTVIESIPGSEIHPPLTIAYLQGLHYQSLCSIVTPAASTAVPSSTSTLTPLVSSSESGK